MVEVTRDGERYEVTVSVHSDAPPRAVYALLADLQSHIEWGGSWHPRRSQHLRSMHAPAGRATVGVEFTSEGNTPEGSWHDRSRVTKARPPTLFEFLTEGTFEDSSGQPRMSLRAVHRYAIRSEGPGSKVTYLLRARLRLHHQGENAHPRLPAVVFNLVVPAVIERGTHNLARMAEGLAAEGTPLEPARTVGLAGA